MSLFQNLKVPYWSKYYRRSHLSIDTLPVETWFKISETNDFSMLITRGLYSYKELESMWLDIQQQYLDEFGLDNKYAQYLKLQKKILSTKIDLAITENRHLENLIVIYQADLDAIYTQEKREFTSNLVLLERSYGISIDPIVTSVKKYYYYVKHG